MEKLNTVGSIPYHEGQMYLVSTEGSHQLPSWLLHTQIELDGNRVFVRWVDTSITSEDFPTQQMVGIVVSPVY